MRLRNKAFVLEDASEQNLKKLRFEYMHFLSTPEDKLYVYSFPVYKCGKKTVLTCDLKVFEGDGNVDIEVVNSLGMAYAPFYSSTGDTENRVVDQICQSILGRMRKMGIKEKEREKKNGSEDIRRVPDVHSRNNRRNIEGENQSVLPEEGEVV